MPVSEKHSGQSARSFSQQHRRQQQQQPPQPCATTTTARRNGIRKSRSASREENNANLSGPQRYKSRSLSRASLRSSRSVGGGGRSSSNTPAKTARHPVNPSSNNTTTHCRSGSGIPNISLGRRRGRSETPKVGEGDGRKLRQHRSQPKQEQTTGGGGVMHKFRSLSRTTPYFLLRGKGNDRDGGRVMKQQKDRHRLKTSPSQEHQYSRRNTSNEARRKFHSTDETTTLPIPKRGKSLPSRLKVSMRLSRDSQHPHTEIHTSSNHHSSRSRSRNRSSARAAIRSKSQSISHEKKRHVSSGQRLGDKQHKWNTSAKDKNDTSHRHTRSSPSRKTHANHHNRVRSKSMPSTGIQRNDILHVDRHQLIKNPISAIASIDSSWRYKRITMLKRLQRHRQRQPRGRNSDGVYYEKERIRSISCDPSILRLALVPYHAKQHPSTKDKSKTYLNYNLGEMDEELAELLRQQRSRSSLDSTSLEWPSRSSPKTSMPWGRSRRCGVSTPTDEERASRGENEKVVTNDRSSNRRAGNGGEDFSHIISTGEADTDTTGWQGHAPDPVKSLYGSSNLAEDLTYQHHHRTPYSLPLPEPPSVTGPSSPDNSRESFIGIIESDGGWSSGKKSNYSESPGEDRSMSSSKRRESMSTPSSQMSPPDPITKHDDDKDNEDSDSPESIPNKAPLTHAKYEKKIDSGFLVPPLHSMVRSRKPKAKVGPILPHHHRSHSQNHPINVKPDGTVKHSASVEFESRSIDGVVEGMTIQEQDSDSTSDRMSEVTMPLALSHISPPHELIRSVKPQNRLHGNSSHPTSSVTRHPKLESQKHHPEGMPPQFLSALRAMHQVNTSLEHSHKSLDHTPTVTPVSLYPPPPPPPPPPRRMAPGPPPRNQYRQAMNQQQQQQSSANVDIPTRHVQPQTHPPGVIPKTALDDLYQSADQLRSLRERHYHSDRALFPPQASRDRYVEMTGNSHPGILHSSMRDLSTSNSSNNWQLHQLLHSSTTELARMRGTIPPEREEQSQVPPISLIGGSTIARQRGKRVENMPFMDENQDMGLYTGETNDLGQPHGKGQMRYDNGIFFEGKWTNGVQDGVGASRERLLSGFTSWKGTTQSKKNGTTTGKEFAHGMIWVNPFNGRSGRYTGDLNQHGMPHGRGVMRYDFGLIVEGEWNNGQIIDDSFRGCPVPSTLLAGSVGDNFFSSP